MDQTETVAPVEATQIPSTEAVETTEVTPQEPEQQEPPKDDADKTVKRLERRINQKHAQAAAAEERARMIEAQLTEARQRLSQYETPQETQQQAPDPFKLAEVIATVREVNAKANKVAAEGKSRFPDFIQALQEVAQEVGPLFDAQRGGLPTAVGEAILDSDDPAALLHHLGTNPDVAADLRGLSPIQVARRVARIEAELSKPREPKESKAPKPITPVKSGKTDTTALSDELPLDEWAKRFREMRRGK
jgi:hypothetical protein